MKKIANVVVLCLFAYPVGLLIGTVLILLWLTGALKIRGRWRNFPHFRRRVVLVCNHPYKGEQFLLIGLFILRYVLWPFNGPYTAADAANYHSNPQFRWLLKGAWTVTEAKNFCRSLVSLLGRPRIIPIVRTEGNGDSKGLIMAKHIQKSGGSTIWFPEGGRTPKGKEFLTSISGKRLRVPLKKGFATLVLEPGATLVVVWFEYYHWYNMRFVISEPKVFPSETSREEVSDWTAHKFLELADQAG